MPKSLGDAIKRLSLQAMESSGQVDVRYGVVISTMPLRIQLTPDFIIGNDIVMVPNRLCPREVAMSDVSGELEDVTWYIHEGLNVGDSVAMIRESGGGKYYILDKYRLADEGDISGRVIPDDD